MDLRGDTEYVVNFVNLANDVKCGCKRATVQFLTWYTTAT